MACPPAAGRPHGGGLPHLLLPPPDGRPLGGGGGGGAGPRRLLHPPLLWRPAPGRSLERARGDRSHRLRPVHRAGWTSLASVLRLITYLIRTSAGEVCFDAPPHRAQPGRKEERNVLDQSTDHSQSAPPEAHP